jgi:hypothetical protein
MSALGKDSSRGPRTYTWVTWITPFLSDQDKCFWKPWYKSHYRYAKVPDTDPEGAKRLEQWCKDHDAMTNARAANLVSEGLTVKLEDANSFVLRGKYGDLSGKPDLVAIRPGQQTAHIVDEKSGKKYDKDPWQVKVYIFAKELTDLKGFNITGEVEYRGGSTDIIKLDDADRAKISGIMQIVSGPNEPRREPSPSECRFCDILNCPDRYQTATVTADVSARF